MGRVRPGDSVVSPSPSLPLSLLCQRGRKLTKTNRQEKKEQNKTKQKKEKGKTRNTLEGGEGEGGEGRGERSEDYSYLS